MQLGSMERNASGHRQWNMMQAQYSAVDGKDCVTPTATRTCEQRRKTVKHSCHRCRSYTYDRI